MAGGLSAAEEERLRSWAIEIVEMLIPGVKWRDEGSERRAVGQGGLSINKTGAWYHHAAGKGGWSGISLIEHLAGCSRADAEERAKAWLSTHPGTGDCGADGEGDINIAEYAREIIAKAVDPLGTAAEVYLRSRGIDPPYPACVKFLPHARCGEGAIVGLLTAGGQVVGCQIGYLDPDGRKSTIPPFRRRIMVEKAPCAIFDIRNGLSGPLLACEGIEDSISLAKLGRFAVIGLPGIGTLPHLPFGKGQQITVVRDGDAPDSPADKALHAGIDHLIVRGAEVDLTATPAGSDANAVLLESGIDGLAALVDGATPAELSKPSGLILWAASFDDLDYESQRKAIALKAGIRVGTLDLQRMVQRRALFPQANVAPPEEFLDEDVDIGEVLDGIVKELKRYIVATEADYTAAGLWAAHSYLLHHEKINLTVSPHLGIQARDYGCGKTLLLEILSCLVSNPRLVSGATASSMFRIIDAIHPTFLIDEVDQLLGPKPDHDLLQILNAAHRCKEAFIDRSVPTPDGKSWVAQKFSVWTPFALAGVGELPPSVQQRSVIINLRKVLARDVKEHLQDGESPELNLLQRQLATWASLLDELPKPEMPAELQLQAGRISDNWRPLMAIAELAEGDWPERAKAAILASIAAEQKPSPIARLLVSIKAAFDADYEVWDAAAKKHVKATEPRERFETKDLLNMLLADADEEWSTANRGREITAYWLRDRLRGLLDPKGSQDWWEDLTGPTKTQVHRSGYLRTQFEKSWETYLIPDPPKPSGASGLSSVGGNINEQTQRVNRAHPPHPMASEQDPSGAAARNGQAIDFPSDLSSDTPDKPDKPDTPDGLGGSRGYTPPTGDTGSEASIRAEALRLQVEHPGWSARRIAKHLGQQERRIARYLNGNTGSGHADDSVAEKTVLNGSGDRHDDTVGKMVGRFFEPGIGGLWLEQRLAETPEERAQIKIRDARWQWLTDFDALPAEMQAALKRQIESEKIRRGS